MKYEADNTLTALHNKAFADDQFTCMVTRYRQQQDKHLRPAHLVEFEEGCHGKQGESAQGDQEIIRAQQREFSERALEKIAKDVVAHAVLIDHTRPLMWLTRKDLERQASYGFGLTVLLQYCEINRSVYEAEQTLADYLPEGV